MTVAGARRDLASPGVQHPQIGGERAIDGVLHRHFDDPAAPGAFTVEQRGRHRGVQVDAGTEIAHGRPGFHRRMLGMAGHADHAGHGLHDQVHGGVIAIRAILAVAGGGAIDQPLVDLQQRCGAEPETVHHAGREVLD